MVYPKTLCFYMDARNGQRVSGVLSKSDLARVLGCQPGTLNARLEIVKSERAKGITKLLAGEVENLTTIVGVAIILADKKELRELRDDAINLPATNQYKDWLVRELGEKLGTPANDNGGGTAIAAQQNAIEQERRQDQNQGRREGTGATRGARDGENSDVGGRENVQNVLRRLGGFSWLFVGCATALWFIVIGAACFGVRVGRDPQPLAQVAEVATRAKVEAVFAGWDAGLVYSNLLEERDMCAKEEREEAERRLKREIEEAKARIEKAQAQALEWKAAAEEAAIETGKRTAEVEELGEQVEAAEAETEEAEARTVEWKAKAEEATGEAKQWTEEVDEVLVANKVLEEKPGEAREEVARRETEAARREAEAGQEETEDAREETEAARRESEDALQYAEAARQETEAAKEEADAARREADAAREETKVAQKEVRTLNKTNERLAQRLVEAEKSRSQTSSQTVGAWTQAQVTGWMTAHALSQLIKERDAFAHRASELGAEIRVLRGELKAQSEAADRKDGDVRWLQEELEKSALKFEEERAARHVSIIVCVFFLALIVVLTVKLWRRAAHEAELKWALDLAAEEKKASMFLAAEDRQTLEELLRRHETTV